MPDVVACSGPHIVSPELLATLVGYWWSNVEEFSDCPVPDYRAITLRDFWQRMEGAYSLLNHLGDTANAIAMSNHISQVRCLLEKIRPDELKGEGANA